MGIVLKGIEIENFKSYTEKQYIQLSDLSVFLGANSSGKSTALQALLVLKQTIECNSPDEELLLSGKYVALGDFDDVISADNKEYFSLAIILGQSEKSEDIIKDDTFKISYYFERAEDGISAMLKSLDVVFQDLTLSFSRKDKGIYYMYINKERSPFSVKINNLIIKKYFLHYDKELNNKAAELLNEISGNLLSKKITKVGTEKPISIEEIENFYFRLLDSIQGDENNKLDLKNEEIVKNLGELIDKFGELILPRYKSISRGIPTEICNQILGIVVAKLDDVKSLDKIVSDYSIYLDDYRSKKNPVDEFQGFFDLGSNPFIMVSRNEKKDDNISQLKYALSFYKNFLTAVLAKVFFVGPIRENPKGLYNIGFETIPKYVGPTGSYFASVLLHENKKQREYILPGRKEKCTLSEALAAWMIHMNVASSVGVDKKNSFGFSVTVENLEQIKSDIMNVGIGTSQVLPVLISVLLSEPDEILVFEQPELHLHPYSQSRLADMFMEFCKCGRKIILETHSEYFLLRLRYHIVKEDINPEAVSVDFFQNTGGTKVTHKNISGFGNIEYPDDFRDETQELLDAILDASLERKGLL